MNSSNSYHTKQQQAILSFMENNKNGYIHFKAYTEANAIHQEN